MPDIVLKDIRSNEIEYPGVNTIQVSLKGGGVQNFGAFDPDSLTPEKLLAGETVGPVVGTLDPPDVLENLPVGLDFSNGNQSIVAPDGYVVKSAVIEQPENLIPENIAEGVNIAGIIGALAGGSNVKLAAGTFTGNDSTVTIEHGFGSTPDVFVASKGVKTEATDNYRLENCVVLSAALKTALNLDWRCFYILSKKYNSSYSQISLSVSGSTTMVGSMDGTKITVANTSYPTENGKTYRWLAIGGLT